MNKLDKASQKEWAAITLTLETAESRLSQAIDSAIETVAAVVRSEPADGQSVDDCIAEFQKEQQNAAEEALEDLFTEYTDAIEAVIDFAQNVRDEAQGYFDDKSERWQEGEKGEEFTLFIESWNEIANIDIPTLRDLFEFDGEDGVLTIMHPDAIDDGSVQSAQMFPGQ